MNYTEYLAIVDLYKDKPVDKPVEWAVAENPLNVSADRVIATGEIIVAAANNDIQRLVQASGLTGYGFGKKFDISPRTVQAWSSGQRNAPDYVVKLLAFVLLDGFV